MTMAARLELITSPDESTADESTLEESTANFDLRPLVEAPPIRTPDPGSPLMKLSVVLIVAIAFMAMFFFGRFVWPSGGAPSLLVARVLKDLCWVWAVNLLPALLGLVGLLAHPRRKPLTAADLVPIPQLVSFRIVTRGHNIEALTRTVAAVQRTMQEVPLFPYLIEVVTDNAVPLAPADDLDVIVVPPDYQTATGAMFKARALQYALESTLVPEDTWVFHLDEESRIEGSTVVGIRAAVKEEEASGELRIGQGLILYHSDLKAHPILTLADSMRTGDDLGRFYLQQRFGRALFGLHGSFILVRQDVEREVGFDIGPDGSITEDAYWALVEMGTGRRIRCVDGVVLEQSTHSVRDFMKQRRRWFIGLVHVVTHVPVSWRHRLMLMLSVGVWLVSWLSIVAAVAIGITQVTAPTGAFVLGSFAFAAFIAEYLVGLHVNLVHRGKENRRRRACLYLIQGLCVPMFSILEAAGIVYALVRPERGFHVVKK